MSLFAASTSFLAQPYPGLLKAFASSEPVPGGGSAAAMTGALSASLASMVAGLTEHKPGYEEVGDQVRRLRVAGDSLRATLLGAADMDADAFEGVMRAMGLPKATDEEKAARKEAMQAALRGATEAPLRTANACVDAGDLALRLLAIGNKNASSDAACAVLLAAAGAEAALLNVAINLGSLKDEAFKAQATEQSQQLWRAAAQLREKLWPVAKAAGLDTPY